MFLHSLFTKEDIEVGFCVGGLALTMLNNKIKVFARIKPPKDCIRSHTYEIKTNKFDGSKKILLLHGGDDKYCLNSQQKIYDTEEFLFENVFTESTTQECIYNSMAKPVVQRAIEGFNGTIMAYGQTGTGKTHTICGGRDKGIIPRAFKDVFNSMKEVKQNYKVFLSVMEIYNEHAYDLLCDRFAKDKTKQVTPRNLKTVQVCNMHQLDKLLKKSWSNRIVSETPMNDASSRSHCIFSLHLHQNQNSSSSVMISKVHMIDLSGSEKLGKKRPSGVLLNETRHINLSLHYIELVIRALSDKNRDHIPYRNSMITSFLRDSLGGNSNTVMVFTLSLEPMFFEETVLTCRFAQRVSLISNKMKKQISQNQDVVVELTRNESMEQLEQIQDEPNLSSNYNNNYIRDNPCNNYNNSTDHKKCSNSPSNHIGINCKLDSDSISSSSSCQFNSEQMSIFDDEDLTNYIDELLSEEDLSSLHYCYEKHQKEERNNIIELNSIQRSLSGLIDVTKAFKMFSPKSLDVQHGSYGIYEHLGLCLPSKDPKTGKLYKTNEREEFFKFLSRTINLNNFKTEYYDEYCDLLVKEYHASSSLNKCILQYEKSKNKFQSKYPSSPNKERHERQLKMKDIKIKEKENLLEEIRNERVSLYKKVEDLKSALIKQFHDEWLPEKESVIIYTNKNNTDESLTTSKTQKFDKGGKLKGRINRSSKILGKTFSNTNEYRSKEAFQESIKVNKLKASNAVSETLISCLSRDSHSKASIISEE